MMQMTSSHWKHQVNLTQATDPSSRAEGEYQTELAATEAVNRELVRLLDDYSLQKSQLSKHEPRLA
jgi:hypothetical protein